MGSGTVPLISTCLLIILVVLVRSDPGNVEKNKDFNSKCDPKKLTPGAPGYCYDLHDLDPAGFIFGNEKPRIVIYRLIGNDMPPLQQIGQLRWNTKYALDNEVTIPEVSHRFILNRIWNETEFSLIYSALVSSGVHRRDIIVRCFDVNIYNSIQDTTERNLYMTSQNEGRNVGIEDGKASGFEWIVILDGNTFITKDSLQALVKGLDKASKDGKKYFKIPYHRVHSEQTKSWLNSSTTMKTTLLFSPAKGESQIAFHRTSTETFSLGDTNPDKHEVSKKKGYGQRNKSYLFKEGQICGPESTNCACANVIEGNEEDIDNNPDIAKQYTSQCGLILRLWNYPTDDVIYTGLDPIAERGFFCYLKAKSNEFKKEILVLNKGHDVKQCAILKYAVGIWISKNDLERSTYFINETAANLCRKEYAPLYLTESCFRAEDRIVAQQVAQKNIPKYGATSASLCNRLRPLPTSPMRKHALNVFYEPRLQEEKALFAKNTNTAITPLIDNLVRKAKKSLVRNDHFSVMKKKKEVHGIDKRYYLSWPPYYWPYAECPNNIKDDVKSGGYQKEFGIGKVLIEVKGKTVFWNSELGPVEDTYIKRDGIRIPGTVIGGENEDYYDRAAWWYMVDNSTTLALAWYFTDDVEFAKKGADLIRTWFLNPATSTFPSLRYAQYGRKEGVIDFKDLYILIDSITLIEKSGQLTHAEIIKLQKWMNDLATYVMSSTQGHDEGHSRNNHALYFDITLLSCSIFSFNDDTLDQTRARLKYRLTKPYPYGHFDRNGALPDELSRPIAFHYLTFTLVGWIHAALLVESARSNCELPGSIESLWWMRHEGATRQDDPVLLKAVKWMIRYLPSDARMYNVIAMPVPGMNVDFGYEQEDKFQFDRVLEIVNNAVRIYSARRVFEGQENFLGTKVYFDYPLYSTNVSMLTTYSSSHPDSGAKLWPSLGLPQPRKFGISSDDSIKSVNADRKLLPLL